MSSELGKDFDGFDIDVDGEKLIRIRAVNCIGDSNVINGVYALGIDKITDI
jgi:hypothetical protein